MSAFSAVEDSSIMSRLFEFNWSIQCPIRIACRNVPFSILTNIKIQHFDPTKWVRLNNWSVIVSCMLHGAGCCPYPFCFLSVLHFFSIYIVYSIWIIASKMLFVKLQQVVDTWLATTQYQCMHGRYLWGQCLSYPCLYPKAGFSYLADGDRENILCCLTISASRNQKSQLTNQIRYDIGTNLRKFN